ncbi:DUF1127 domain-containing protein [Shinella sp. BYT-45]|uniref:DUF1127 domain-containing protein n=1 Tax=Shinella sp. BYT-45 TaxID=3377377 RepID=UPI00398008F1
MAIDTIFTEARTGNRSSTFLVLYRGWRAYRAWRIKRRTRHALLEMTDSQLRDIGVSRGEARREFAKSFYWD